MKEVKNKIHTCYNISPEKGIEVRFNENKTWTIKNPNNFAGSFDYLCYVYDASKDIVHVPVNDDKFQKNIKIFQQTNSNYFFNRIQEADKIINKKYCAICKQNFHAPVHACKKVSSNRIVEVQISEYQLYIHNIKNDNMKGYDSFRCAHIYDSLSQKLKICTDYNGWTATYDYILEVKEDEYIQDIIDSCPMFA